VVAAPVERVFDAFVDPLLRERWLPGIKLVARTATRSKVAHFDWSDTGSRLHATFVDKGNGRSLAAVQHARLADAAEADRMRAHWRAALAALKTHLENGAADA